MVTSPAQADAPAVELRGLTKVFGDRHIALSPTDLTVKRGSIFGLIGPNGAGKTTAFRMMIGLQRPTAGEVRILGEPMHANAAELRRRVGYLPTGARFPASATPIEYLRFVARVSGLDHDTSVARTAVLLRDLDLLTSAGDRIGNFSTGMITRLGIAGSMINDPELLIWDEPTTGLDPVGRRQVTDLVKTLGKSRTIVVSTHVLGDVDRVCDDVGILYRGRLIYSGSIAEMKRRVQGNAIELELDGDGRRVIQRAAGWELGGEWEWQAPILRVKLQDTAPLATAISELLALVAAEGIALVAMNTGLNQMEDAFLRQLDEDRKGAILSGWGDAVTRDDSA
jgi:ABC-2 type transport system ATP-binding protein